MPRFVVLDHHLDEVADPPVYRAVIGLVDDVELPVVDPETGEQELHDPEPVMQPRMREVTRQPDGAEIVPFITQEPIVDEETGEPEMEPVVDKAGRAVTTQRGKTAPSLLVHDTHEILWTAGDSRWARMKPETIAKKQREEIKTALDALAAEADRQQRQVAGRKSLPGVGTDL